MSPLQHRLAGKISVICSFCTKPPPSPLFSDLLHGLIDYSRDSYSATHYKVTLERPNEENILGNPPFRGILPVMGPIGYTPAEIEPC